MAGVRSMDRGADHRSHPASSCLGFWRLLARSPRPAAPRLAPDPVGAPQRRL